MSSALEVRDGGCVEQQKHVKVLGYREDHFVEEEEDFEETSALKDEEGPVMDDVA